MIKVEKVLTGIDLGPDTEMVLAYASFFCKLFNATVQLLYVIDYLVTPPAYMTPYIEEEKNSALKTLNTWQERLSSLGIKTRIEVIVGRLYESFDFSIKNLKVNLLVLGYRSHPLRRSSSEKLIKGLRIPMLVVRGQRGMGMKIGDVNISKILCPIDFSEPSMRALSFASDLSNLTGSRLDILHVLQINLLKEKGEKGLKAIEDMKEETKKRIKGITEEVTIPSAKGHVLTGEPHKEIISFSKDSDLIVIGARGLGFIQSMILGSVTEAVLRSSPCPVLIIH